MRFDSAHQRVEYSFPSHEAAAAIDWSKIRNHGSEQVRELLDEKNLDAIVLTDIENVRYVTHVRPVHSVFFVDSYHTLVTPEETIVLAPAGDAPRIKNRMPWIDRVEPIGRQTTVPAYEKLIEEYEINRLGVDSLGFELADAFRSSTELTGVGEEIERRRAVKLPEEVAVMDEAGAVCEGAVLAALDAVEQGVREYEVAAAAEYEAKLAGAQGVSWAPATFSGTNTGLFLRYDSEKRLRYGDLVVLGYAFVYQGYNMDITVTTVVGEPTETQREMYTAVWDAREAAIDAIEPGVTGREVRDIAATVINERGFSDWSFVDYQPIYHGLGLSVYEQPYAPTAGIDEPSHELRPGHVIVPEPGVYAVDEPSVGGVRIGEPVIVTKDGCERLAQVVPDRHEDLYVEQ